MHGFGVPPDSYVRMNFPMIRFLKFVGKIQHFIGNIELKRHLTGVVDILLRAAGMEPTSSRCPRCGKDAWSFPRSRYPCSRISHAATELSTPPLIAIRALFSLSADIFLLQFFRNPPQAVVVLLQIGLKSVRVVGAARMACAQSAFLFPSLTTTCGIEVIKNVLGCQCSRGVNPGHCKQCCR